MGREAEAAGEEVMDDTMETRTVIVHYTDGRTATAQHTGRWAAFLAWCRLWVRKAEVRTLERV